MTSKKTKGLYTLILALIAASLTSTSTFAQIEEIVVTATKRQSTLQEIPVAVTVVSSQDIQQSRILDVLDLQSLVPSLRVSQLQSSQNVNFTIRGFGNGANNAGIEPSVGVFVDGVFRSRSAASIGDLPLLERVEVLKGPQSTLFGKNASAGVISIVTRKPQFETEGFVEVGFGRFNETTVKAFGTTGINEKLAVSLGGGLTQRDGYFTSIDPSLSDTNDRNRWNIRGQALYNFSDTIEARLIADYSTLDEQCCGVTNVVESGTTALIQSLAEDPANALADVNDPFTFTTFQNSDSINELDDFGISFHLDIETSKFDISSITAYRDNDSFFDTDADYSRLNSLDSVASDQQISTFTQEIRFTSNSTDSKLDWMIGGFLFIEEVDQVGSLEYGTDLRDYINALAGGALVLDSFPPNAQPPFPPGLAGLPIIPFGTPTVTNLVTVTPGLFFNGDVETRETFTQDDTTYSIFGTLDYHLSEKITLTVGANYTQSVKDVTGSTVNNDPFSALNLRETLFVDLVAGFPLVAGACGLTDTAFSDANASALAGVAAGGGCPVTGNPALDGAIAGVTGGLAGYLGLRGLQFQPQFLPFPNAVESGETDDDDLTWVARVAYDLNENNNLYFSAATGFKASSWNLSRDSRPFASDETALRNSLNIRSDQTFGTRFALPEETTVYEIGLKGSYDRVSYIITLFDQTIENFQSNAFIGAAFVLTNAEEQSVQGAEIDITYTPIDDLTLKFSGTFLDPVFDSFTNAPGPLGVPIDRSGEEPDNVDTTSLSFSANYNFVVNSNVSGYFRADFQYEDATPHSVNLTVDSLNLAATVSPGGLGAVVDFTPGFESRRQRLVNASLGLSFENDIELTFWGRNIFNDQFFTTLFPGVAQFGVVNAYPNQPATYGVSVRKSF